MHLIELNSSNCLADDIAPAADDSSWKISPISVPPDGSCFFRSIAIAMNDCIDTWHKFEDLRNPMERYWEGFAKRTGKDHDEVTPALLRYMCAVNIGDDTLEQYNAEAAYRRDTLREAGVAICKDIEELRTHILQDDTWVDHATFGAFLKSLNFRLGLVVLDPECGGLKYLPPEWTVGKSLYVFLLRKRNHYSVLRLKKGGNDLELCLPHDTTNEFVGWLQSSTTAAVLSAF